MHAITAANNLLCAAIDNHMQQGNELQIDQRRILFKRCLDMNDRALRNIVIGMGGKINGIPREDSFQITVASEIMAILCLAADLDDLKKRISNILIGYNYTGEPIYADDLNVQGAMTALLKDALKPCLLYTSPDTASKAISFFMPPVSRISSILFINLFIIALLSIPMGVYVCYTYRGIGMSSS